MRLEVIQKTALLGTACKDTKESTVPVRRRKRRDLGPVVTCCNPLPRTVNHAESTRNGHNNDNDL